MIPWTEILILWVVLLIGSPPLAFMIMKFGTAGFFRGREHYRKQETKQKEKQT